MPKSAGTSLFLALEDALPDGAVSTRRMDPAAFCCFDAFDRLGADARSVVVADEQDAAELAAAEVVSGHFALSTLERLAPPERIGTVLREPRARLVSQYLYLRLTPGIRELWAPYDTFTPADGPLDAFLADERIATATDNKTCRMLLDPDPRIRDGAFIAAGDLEGVAEDAWRRLEQLGYVGLLEWGDETWTGLGRLFGVELTPGRANATGAVGERPGALPVPPAKARALALLGHRTAADAVLYRRIAARRLGDEHAALRFAAGAFTGQLRQLAERT